MPNDARARSIRKAVVLVKETYLEQLKKTNNQEALEKIKQGDASMDKIILADAEHHNTIRVVSACLTSHGIAFEFRDRKPGAPYNPDGDLIITLGGDGTFLDASHYIKSDVPLLGVNSAPSSSHGHYCLVHAGSFATALDEILSGQRKTYPLMRLGIWKDGQLIAEPVLNEVLIADESPAGTSRYIVFIGDKNTEHLSAGLLISTSAGSTGFMRSSPDGQVLPITGDEMQFRTRSWCSRPGQSPVITRGLVKRGEHIRVISKMTDGKLLIDGKHIAYDFTRGSEIIVKAHPSDLHVYIDPNLHDRYMTSRLHRLKLWVQNFFH